MTIETTRLIIRLAHSNDVQAIHDILRDPVTMTYFVEGTYTTEQVHSLLQKNVQTKEHYVLVSKDSQEIIGKLSFHPWFMDSTYEIGWIMNKNYSNQGYMTEAAIAMIEYGFKELQLHRIIATCQPQNIPSKRLCERLGMRLEGTFKQCIKAPDGSWWDELFYAILAEEYNKNE